MMRFTFVLANLMSLFFTPLVAQEADCDGWVGPNFSYYEFSWWELTTSETVSDCLHAGNGVNARTSLGSTPLHLSVTLHDNSEILHVLLKAYANVNARTLDGNTPLHYAAERNNNPDTLTLLLNAGAEVNAINNDGNTPLHLAVESRNSDFIIRLLDFGAHGAVTNKDGKTPFDLLHENEALIGTEAYWALNDAKFE